MRETMRGFTLEPFEIGKADEEVVLVTVHSPHTLWLFFPVLHEADNCSV